jgi:23S rRNA-/tRNA-specific pseudouridylate synthase
MDALHHKLPHIPVESWPERFEFGGVYVNGHAANDDGPLPCPCRVEYYEPKFDISIAREMFPKFESNYVLYSDDYIAVVFKPPKLPSMPAKEQRHFSLKASIERLLGRSIHMPSRLDVSAQGLVVVSINPKTHGALQRAFEERTVHKVYRLGTDSPVNFDQRTVTFRIGRDSRHPVLRAPVETGGQDAVTAFSHLWNNQETATGPSTVLSAEPVTGRTHQIRVHAAFSGFPIKGDNFYGGTPAQSLHLVSYAVSLRHPVSGSPLTVELPISLGPEWVRTASKPG